MHPLLNIAFQAARNAGDVMLQYLDRLDRVRVKEKSINDLVSEVDLKAEQIIISTIHKAYPNHSILAEETGEQRLKEDDYLWIIDPLDGTTNYLHGFPQFAVSIALAFKGKIEHGLIYDPFKKEVFSASRGRGAQLNANRIRVSSATQLSKSLLGTGIPSRNKDTLEKYMQTFGDICLSSAGIRRAGAGALDLAYVASGRLDGFWEYGLKPWDIAAGSLLVTEAGGLISDMNNQGDYLKSGNVVAGNTKIHSALIDIVSQYA